MSLDFLVWLLVFFIQLGLLGITMYIVSTFFHSDIAFCPSMLTDFLLGPCASHQQQALPSSCSLLRSQTWRQTT